MSHTPGPWWVDGPDEGIEVHDTFGRTASVWGDQDDNSEAWANARLIAAAPDMLDALRTADDALDYAQAQVDSESDRERLRHWRTRVQNVIALAEGR